MFNLKDISKFYYQTNKKSSFFFQVYIHHETRKIRLCNNFLFLIPVVCRRWCKNQQQQKLPLSCLDLDTNLLFIWAKILNFICFHTNSFNLASHQIFFFFRKIKFWALFCNFESMNSKKCFKKLTKELFIRKVNLNKRRINLNSYGDHSKSFSLWCFSTKVENDILNFRKQCFRIEISNNLVLII